MSAEYLARLLLHASPTGRTLPVKVTLGERRKGGRRETLHWACLPDTPEAYPRLLAWVPDEAAWPRSLVEYERARGSLWARTTARRSPAAAPTAEEFCDECDVLKASLYRALQELPSAREEFTRCAMLINAAQEHAGAVLR